MSQRFLTNSASFFSTALLLVSLAEHLMALKMSLQIVAIREDTGFNRPQLKEMSPARSTKQSTCAIEEAEKPINMSSAPGNLLYGLFT
jgi:hypothetical protein